jgi:hypothetical protein
MPDTCATTEIPLRPLIAAVMAHGILSGNGSYVFRTGYVEEVVRDSVNLADALLAELAKEEVRDV